MNLSLISRLEELAERMDELSQEMSDPAVVNDNDRFRRYSQEYAQLEPVVATYRRFRGLSEEIDKLRDMAGDTDPEIRDMARSEMEQSEGELEQLSAELRVHLIPKDPLDERNIFLEIRAGTGGDEAALFAGDLFEMYGRYAATQGWEVEILSSNPGEHGGYREIISRIVGLGAYSRMKFESGTHRVQRVPATESQGRIHTSACTVAVLPELDDIDDIEIESKDMRIDTYRASGAGGQHVNKTDSAVRITHLPTGIVVECQDERSQHKNRARAMSLLQARLMDAQREAQSSAQAASRKQMVGSGDRSERIRTYNYPQGRITDHRINLTLYKLEGILGGELDPLVQPLIQEYQAAQLSELGV